MKIPFPTSPPPLCPQKWISSLIFALAPFLIPHFLSPSSEATSSKPAPLFDPLILGGKPIRDTHPLSSSTVFIQSQFFQRGDSDLPRTIYENCSGLVISPRAAITAAHCVYSSVGIIIAFTKTLPKEPKGWSQIPTLLGTQYSVPPDYLNYLRDSEEFWTKAKTPTEISPARRFKVNQMNQGDLALVFFQGGLPQGVQAISLSSLASAPKPPPALFVGGFGRTQAGIPSSTSSQFLMSLVTVAQWDYSPTEVLLDQTGRRGACHGDSGGPAWTLSPTRSSPQTLQVSLLGIISRGVNDPQDLCQKNAVITLLYPYRDWIQKQL